MPQTKIRKRQIQLEGSDGLHSEYLRRTVDDATDYKLTVAQGKPPNDPGLDLTGHRIVNVADAQLDTDAPNWGQVRALVAQGDYRGEIQGYVVVRGGATKYVQDANGDGVNEETSTPQITGLYLYISNANGRVAGDVARWTGSSWICDNTQGTFDSNSPQADPGGELRGALYLMAVAAQPGDILPRHTPDTGEWTSDVYLKWNPSYDVAGSPDVGRWEIWGSATNIPFATKNSPGKVQIGDGIQVSGGVISADPDTTRGISWSGSSPNAKFGLNVLSPMKFTGGALDLARVAPSNTTGDPNAGAGDTGGIGYWGKVGFYLDSANQLAGQLSRHTLNLHYEYGQFNQLSTWWLANLAIVGGGALNLKSTGTISVSSTGAITFGGTLFIWYRGGKLQGGAVTVIQIPGGTTPALSNGDVLVWRPSSVPNYSYNNSSTYPQSLSLNSGNFVVLTGAVTSATTSYENATDIPIAVRLNDFIYFLDGTVVPVGRSISRLGRIDWMLIENAPPSFPPSSHTHPATDVTFTNSDTWNFCASPSTIDGAVRELLRLQRRRAAPQTFLRCTGQYLNIELLDSSGNPVAMEKRIRGIGIVFRRSRRTHGAEPLNSTSYLLGDPTGGVNRKIIDFGGGDHISTTSASTSLGVRLHTERGIAVSYDGFRAAYFAHSDNEWHTAILTFNPPTWGAAPSITFYPHGQGAPDPGLPIDIARIFLLTDAPAGCIDALSEGMVSLEHVELPIYAITNEGRNANFSETTTDWAPGDSGTNIAIVSGELRITEPSSGAPGTAGLARLASTYLQVRPAKRYCLRLKARASTNASLTLELTSSDYSTVYASVSLNLTTSNATFSTYIETPDVAMAQSQNPTFALRFRRTSGNYSGVQYFIDDIEFYQAGVYADFKGDGIDEERWWSSVRIAGTNTAETSGYYFRITVLPQPAHVILPPARLTTFNVQRRSNADHVAVFSQNNDFAVQHLQKMSLADLAANLGLRAGYVAVKGITLNSGQYDIPLNPNGLVTTPTSLNNTRPSVTVYINGVALTARAEDDAYELITTGSRITHVRLKYGGIGYPITPDDLIEIKYGIAPS
ncbi:MAG: hypothetical protein QXO86_01445 [Nitrososphaerota archaeon]